MLTRRKFIAGSTIACTCGMPHLTLAQESASRWSGPVTNTLKSVGCYVRPEDFKRENLSKLGTNYGEVSSFTLGNHYFKVKASSGNRHFDRALAEALFHVSKTFDVLPTFGFIVGTDIPNAFATKAPFKADQGDDPLPTREDGTVLFGNKIIDLMRSQGVKNEVAAVLAICAHEFGHIVQYNYGYNNRGLQDILMDGQTTVKLVELHADYLAGYYVGTAKKRNPNTPAASIAHAAYAIGDLNVNDPQHHGTHEERGAAVYAGYKASFEQNLPFAEAVVAGLKYVGAIS